MPGPHHWEGMRALLFPEPSVYMTISAPEPTDPSAKHTRLRKLIYKSNRHCNKAFPAMQPRRARTCRHSMPGLDGGVLITQLQLLPLAVARTHKKCDK
jgi:hypothetical protein